MFAVFATVLCLISVSHSAPVDCENTARPLDQLDAKQLDGRWALIAGSLTDSNNENILKAKQSVTIDFEGSAYTQSDRHGEMCQYYPHNITVESPNFTYHVGAFKFSGTLYHTSCADCLVFRLDYESPDYASKDFYLVSRRRELEQSELDEFKAQVECLSMPTPIMMDPTKALCAELAADTRAAATES